MNLIKIFTFVVIFLAIAFFIQSRTQPEAQQRILTFLSETIAPKIPLYNFIKEQIGQGSLLSVAIYISFANIPFVPNPPPEPYVIYAFTKGTNSILLVLTIAIITALTTSISYFIGYLFGPRLIEKITKREFKYSGIMNFLSAPITFIVYTIPLPIPGIFPFLFGAYRSNYKAFVAAVFLGTLIRFSIVIFLFARYGDTFSKLPVIGSLF